MGPLHVQYMYAVRVGSLCRRPAEAKEQAVAEAHPGHTQRAAARPLAAHELDRRLPAGRECTPRVELGPQVGAAAHVPTGR